MLALYHVARSHGHIVAEIVEAEFIVGTESDVAVVSGTAFGGVGFVLVNAVNGRAVEHVERAHPFGVTF